MPRTIRLVVIAASLACAIAPCWAYVPGNGTLYTDDFEGFLDEGWEQGNGYNTPSPWTQAADGGDTSFKADGRGPFPTSPTLHWARHVVHPVSATSFSIAFEYRSELGAGYTFDLELEQRAPEMRRYRLRIAGDGSMSLWRSESGAMVSQVTTGPGVVPAGTKGWLRLAILDDASGHPRVAARHWGGSAASEPGTWTLDFLDEQDTLERVHRFELNADGAPGTETFVDDLDSWGDEGSGVASSVKEVWIVELSHLDIGFTHPPDEIETFAKTHLDQVLDNLDADPDYHWTIETGWWLDKWWERSDAVQHQRMIDALRSGRVTLGAQYADLHTTRVGQEQLSRSLYYASRMAREHGFPLRIWVQDDVPGSSFAVPGIMARAGLDYYVGGLNTGFGGTLDEPSHGDMPFWWVAPDGSRVLAWFTYDSYTAAFKWGFSFFDQLPDMYRKSGEKLPELEEAGYPYPEMMLLRGFDNHYQNFHARNLVDQWNATYDTPKYKLGSAEQFLDMMRAKYGDESFPEYSGDSGAAWAGSFANAPHTHRMVRDAHRKARAAEMLLAAGEVMDGAPDPEAARTELYRQMLESDEHTGAGGWPGYFTPDEMERNNRIHLGYAQDALTQAEDLLEQGVSRALAEVPAAGDALVVFNPLGRERDAWARAELPGGLYGSSFRLVERESGAELVYQQFDADESILFRAESVPSMGYRVYDLVPGAPMTTPDGILSVDASTLENDFYRLEVDTPSGALSQILVQATGRDLIDPASSFKFNELGSTLHGQMLGATPPTPVLPGSANVEILETGPLRVALRVTRTGTPHVETVYRLYRGDDRVEITNVLDRGLMPYVVLDQHSRAYTLTMPFDIHDFEIRTETTTRYLDPLTDGFARGSVFDWHNTEHVMALHDDVQGLHYSVDNTAAHHIEALKSLGASEFTKGDALILSRLVDKADEYEFDDGSVGPYVIEPDVSPLNEFTFHFQATGPSFDPVAASRFGTEAISPLPVRLIGRRPGALPDREASFFHVDAPNVFLFTAKPADESAGVVFRMNELMGVETTLRVGSDVFLLENAELVEADEEGGTPLSPDGDGFTITLQPYGTATLRAQARPAGDEIELSVSKDPSFGEVVLDWSGEYPPFTLSRSADNDFAGPETLVDEESVTSYRDPVLGDGQIWFYLVR